MKGDGGAAAIWPRPWSVSMDDTIRKGVRMAQREWSRRLGFAVKVAGREGLKSNDARRWQSNPHLRVSMEYLREILDYLHEIDVRMYRISSDFVPYCTHPDLPQFHGQIGECRDGLAELGRIARERGIRLSLHPSQYVLLSAQDPAINDKGIADVNAQAELLDAMEQGPEAVVILHLRPALHLLVRDGAVSRPLDAHQQFRVERISDGKRSVDVARNG